MEAKATIFTYGNLLKAAKKCMNGVRWKNSVIKWQENLPKYCLQLEQELASDKFKWSDSIKMMITSPKRRQVNSLLFRDRVVQRCMCDNGLYEDLTRGNIYDNGACQVGKGTTFSRNRLKCHMQRHFRKHGREGWVLSLDIKSFFDSIPHDRMIRFVFHNVRSHRFRWMARDLIKMGGKDGAGIELGSQISQLLAVGYLSPLDYFCKHKAGIDGYVRYCDDIIILVPKECQQPDGRVIDGLTVARNLKAKIIEILKDLGLTLNPKSAIYPLKQGVRFLGFRHKLTSGGAIKDTPVKKKISRERRRLRKMLRKNVSGENISKHLVSWTGYYKNCSDKAIIEHLTSEVTAT